MLLMLDGATLDVISPAVAEGRLPNFGRIFDGGAVLHLATLRPTQAETGVERRGDRPRADAERRPRVGLYRVLGVSARDVAAARLLLRAGAGAIRVPLGGAAHRRRCRRVRSGAF